MGNSSILVIISGNFTTMWICGIWGAPIILSKFLDTEVVCKRVKIETTYIVQLLVGNMPMTILNIVIKKEKEKRLIQSFVDYGG